MRTQVYLPLRLTAAVTWLRVLAASSGRARANTSGSPTTAMVAAVMRFFWRVLDPDVSNQGLLVKHGHRVNVVLGAFRANGLVLE